MEKTKGRILCGFDMQIPTFKTLMSEVTTSLDGTDISNYCEGASFTFFTSESLTDVETHESNSRKRLMSLGSKVNSNIVDAPKHNAQTFMDLRSSARENFWALVDIVVHEYSECYVGLNDILYDKLPEHKAAELLKRFWKPHEVRKRFEFIDHGIYKIEGFNEAEDLLIKSNIEDAGLLEIKSLATKHAKAFVSADGVSSRSHITQKTVKSLDCLGETLCKNLHSCPGLLTPLSEYNDAIETLPSEGRVTISEYAPLKYILLQLSSEEYLNRLKTHLPEVDFETETDTDVETDIAVETDVDEVEVDVVDNGEEDLFQDDFF